MTRHPILAGGLGHLMLLAFIFLFALPLPAQYHVFGRPLSGAQNLRCTDLALTDNAIYRCGYLDASNSLPDSIPNLNRRGSAADFVVVKTNLAGDSILAWARFGGEFNDIARKIRVFRDGRIIVAGTTESPDFPTGVNSSVTIYNGASDCVVAILSPSLQEIITTQTFGGGGADYLEDMELIDDSRIVICGSTTSRNLPTTVPAQIYEPALETSYYGGGSAIGGIDGFIAILTTGAKVQHCRYVGSSGPDATKGVTVLKDGTIAATGSVGSSDFQTLPLIRQFPFGTSSKGSFQMAFQGGPSEAFVIRTNSDLTMLNTHHTLQPVNFASYLGGSAVDVGVDVVESQEGELLVCGHSSSVNIANEDLVQGSLAGGIDNFVARVSLDGRRLVRIIYFGGQRDDVVHGISQSTTGRGFLLYGSTSSMDYPCISMAEGCTGMGSSDVSLAVFNESSFTFSTSLGSNQQDSASGFAFGVSGDMYGGLSTISPSTVFPLAMSLPAISHAVVISIGTIGIADQERPQLACPDGSVLVQWSPSNMRPTDAYTIHFLLQDSTRRTSSFSATRRPTQIPVGGLAMGTYALRIQSARGQFAELSNAITIAEQRQISISVAEDTICADEPIVITTSDNLAFNDTISYSINDSLIIAPAELFAVVRNLPAGLNIVRARTKRGCDPTEIVVADSFMVFSLPAILTHPSSKTAESSTTITLAVEASGSNLRFQWQRNGVAIAGAVEPRLVLTNLSASDEGDYTCEVSNHCGTIVSDAASVRLSTVSVLADGSSDDVVLRGNTIEPRPLTDNVRCTIEIHDVLGRTVTRTVDASLPWTIPTMPSGLYLVRLGMDTKTICLPLIR